GCDCGRYVEIWNLVFMQFNRDSSGALHPLPKPSVDTGAGLERVTAVLQGKISNFDTDLFVPLMQAAAKLGHVDAGDPNSTSSLRIIADHARAATFLISDGVTPSNEGRGYVLRKIIRRAITHGRLLGQAKPFLHEMVFAVRDLMRDAYPELNESAERVSKTVLAEETRFAHTLKIGFEKLEYEIVAAAMNTLGVTTPEGAQWGTTREVIDRALRQGSRVVLQGAEAFRLYDTFGLSLDFINEFCRDMGVEVDRAGFQRAMEEQKTRARASWKGAAKQTANPHITALAEGTNPYADKPGVTEEAKQAYTLRFVGYKKLRVVSRVVAVFSELNPYPLVVAPTGNCFVVLEQNP